TGVLLERKSGCWSEYDWSCSHADSAAARHSSEYSSGALIRSSRSCTCSSNEPVFFLVSRATTGAPFRSSGPLVHRADLRARRRAAPSNSPSDAGTARIQAKCSENVGFARLGQPFRATPLACGRIRLGPG